MTGATAALEAPEAAVLNLEGRAAHLRDGIERLRAGLGAAVLDGAEPDHAAIAAAEAELAGIEAAVGERARRGRAAEAEAERERIAALRLQVKRHLAARKRAVEEAEAGARAMVSALATAEGLRAKLATAIHELGLPVPDTLNVHEQANGFSRHLGALFGTLGGMTRFGNLRWHPSWVRPAEAWLSREGMEIEAVLGEVT